MGGFHYKARVECHVVCLLYISYVPIGLVQVLLKQVVVWLDKLISIRCVGSDERPIVVLEYSPSISRWLFRMFARSWRRSSWFWSGSKKGVSPGASALCSARGVSSPKSGSYSPVRLRLLLIEPGPGVDIWEALPMTRFGLLMVECGVLSRDCGS